MSGIKTFLIGIISGVFVTVLSAFFLNPSITIETDSSSYIDINAAIPHYEFSTENIPYIEYLDITYKIKPPFWLLWFNSEKTVKIPEGYKLIERLSSYESCIALMEQLSDKLIIKALGSQFTFPECFVDLKFVKEYQKKDLIKVVFNSSWRRESKGDEYYEEEGISLINSLNKAIKNYIFVYNQTNNSQIKKRFSECSEIKILINEEQYTYRTNFFEGASVIAAKLDFEPREVKELRAVCQH